MKKTSLVVTSALLVAGLGSLGVSLTAGTAGDPHDATRKPAPPPPVELPRLAPEASLSAAPLGSGTVRGLTYLANQQLSDGGWGQGGGWRTVYGGGRIQPQDQRYQESSDVANTSIAALALLRGGSTPTTGLHAENVRRGLDFVLRNIEASTAGSLYVTEVRGTQLQSKIGPYVDTFLANLLLAEVRGRMGDPESEARLEAALDKVIGKIERHQRDDGTFAGNTGWASVLSQSIANKSLNRARLSGAEVADATLERIRQQAGDLYDEQRGAFSGGDRYGSSAGVKLYEDGAGLAALDDLVKSGEEKEQQARRVLAAPDASPEDKKLAEAELKVLESTRNEKRQASRTMANQLADNAFVAGFGSSGGEEYLSYMNISEALAAEGGEAWQQWNARVRRSLFEAQNRDGSWSGHHCITGRTFVTSAALLTIMADRAPSPLAASVQG